MKFNKIALKVSCILTIICFIVYSCFGYIDYIKNDLIKDIALALLGSSALVIATSLIGYFVERTHLQQEILKAVLDMNFLENAYRINGSNVVNFKDCIKIINEVKAKAQTCYYLLLDYKDGCIKKDEELNDIISGSFSQYLKELEEFEKNLKSKNMHTSESGEDDTLAKLEAKTRQDICSWLLKKYNNKKKVKSENEVN